MTVLVLLCLSQQEASAVHDAGILKYGSVPTSSNGFSQCECRLFLHDRKMIKYTIVFSKCNMQHSIKYTVSNTETEMQHTECCILHLGIFNMFLP